MRSSGATALCVWLAVSVAGAGPAMAGPDSFTSQNGVQLAAPVIASLSCDEMAKLLMSYSGSGYRDVATVPEGHPDRPIYDYENELASQHYADCQAGTARFEDPAPTFGQGFN